jgi:hypothetical protein
MNERYFILQDQHLMFKRTKDSQQVCSAMHIKYAKLVVIEEVHGNSDHDSKYCIKIVFKNKYSTLYAKSLLDQVRWSMALTKHLTRIDFHLRFEIVALIGSGTFAQVYKIREKATGLCFAAKGFSKENLNKMPRGV